MEILKFQYWKIKDPYSGIKEFVSKKLKITNFIDY